MRIRISSWWPVVLLAPVSLTGMGCAAHRVTPMVYSEDNPYAPGGVLYESWEQKRAIDGLLNDTRATHTAIGAAGGAIAGQAIGRDTKGTLMGTGIGVVSGLTSGSIADHNRRIEHEDRMTRLANNWQIAHRRALQNKKDVALGATITQAELQERLKRLEAARAALAERDRNVDRARQLREIEAEIAHLNATVTTR